MDILIWLCVVIVFVIVEITTLGLTSIWFSAGALVAMLATFVTDSFLMQFSVFALSTLVFMVLLKPLTSKFFLKETVKTNFDRIVGEIGIVTTKIAMDNGEVKIDGKVWSAKNVEQFEEIEVGEKVEILEITGVKLVVKKQNI